MAKRSKPKPQTKCRTGCDADRLAAENRRLKAKAEALFWGLETRAEEVVRDLHDTLHELDFVADPVGAGQAESQGDRTKASLAVQAPRRSLGESQAKAAHDGLVRDVYAAMRRRRTQVDELAEAEPESRPPRVRCRTEGCRGRQNGPLVRYCAQCGAEFQTETKGADDAGV